jgi:acetyltransferase
MNRNTQFAPDGSVIGQRAGPDGAAALRVALRPRPSDEIVEHGGQRLVLRPIRPDDEPMLIAFVHALSPQDRRFRFFGTFRELTHEMAVRLTQIDYDRQMAFLLLDGGTLLGVGRLAADADFNEAEFAITVASDCQRRGHGELLLLRVLAHARSRGIKRVVGQVMGENRGMLALAKHLGFVRIAGASYGPEVCVMKSLENEDPESLSHPSEADG